MEIGDVLACRYELEKKLGEGGMGSVFLVNDKKLNRYWAVKECRELQREEAEILKCLDYHVFPRIVDVLEEGGNFYLIMDYVEGVTLKNWMQYHTVCEKQILEWAKELASALLYLHRMQPAVYYMDCKPENIILTKDMEIKMIDMGSVYIKEENKRQQVSGTAFYAPVEQRRCKWEQIGPWSDIYGLGMTLHTLFVKKEKVCRDRKGHLLISKICPGISRKSAALLDKMTRANPKERIQSMEEVLCYLKGEKKIRFWRYCLGGKEIVWELKKDVILGEGKRIL